MGFEDVTNILQNFRMLVINSKKSLTPALSLCERKLLIREYIMSIKTQISRLFRKEQTKAGAVLWKYLRNRKFENLKFRRQYPLKEYIVDFINIEHQIIIELDGEYHNDILQKERDMLRDTHLEALGYTVLRFENTIVFKHPEIILRNIKKHIINTNVPPLPKGECRGEGDKKTNSLTILSTKKLTVPQKELLLNAKVGFVEYDAIQIELLKVDTVGNIQNVIFTSKNAVRAVFNEKSSSPPLLGEKSPMRCFCVGESTKRLLEENGQNVAEIAQNASDLAKIIIKKHRNESFLFFCGNLRRNELPDLLKKHKVALKEQIVYKTYMNSKKFNRSFDGILFFSPSGVQSYISENTVDKSIAFCIGKTTVTEARRHTSNIILANKPTVENVIVQVVRQFKNK